MGQAHFRACIAGIARIVCMVTGSMGTLADLARATLADSAGLADLDLRIRQLELQKLASDLDKSDQLVGFAHKLEGNTLLAERALAALQVAIPWLQIWEDVRHVVCREDIQDMVLRRLSDLPPWSQMESFVEHCEAPRQDTLRSDIEKLATFFEEIIKPKIATLFSIRVAEPLSKLMGFTNWP